MDKHIYRSKSKYLSRREKKIDLKVDFLIFVLEGSFCLYLVNQINLNNILFLSLKKKDNIIK